MASIRSQDPPRGGSSARPNPLGLGWLDSAQVRRRELTTRRPPRAARFLLRDTPEVAQPSGLTAIRFQRNVVCRLLPVSTRL